MPVRSSARPASKRDVAALAPVSRLKSVVFPVLGRPMRPIFMERLSHSPACGYNQRMPTRPQKFLEVVANPHPDRDYEVSMTAPEFTCLCPRTGQPDFATIRIRYVPDQHLVELKSLKLYLWSFRDEGAFHEDVTNKILNDFVAASRPRWAEVVGDFSVRGGIKTEVRATYGKRPEV